MSEFEALLLFNSAFGAFALPWRWRSPGRVATKLLWTAFCLVVPFGPVIMIEFSRPAPPEPIDWNEFDRRHIGDVPPMPGAGLGVISGGALIAGLLIGGIALADSLGKGDTSVAKAGPAVGLFVLGGYGLGRAKTVLARKTSTTPGSRAPEWQSTPDG